MSDTKVINNIKVKTAEGLKNAKLDYGAVAINDSRTLKQGLVGDNSDYETNYLIKNNLVDAFITYPIAPLESIAKLFGEDEEDVN